MKPVSLAKDRPDLSGVFGPLDADDERRVRLIFAEVDAEFLSLLAHFDRGRISWTGTGLELMTYPNTTWCDIAGYVETDNVGDGNHIVSFGVELKPAWKFSQVPASPAWNVDASISADCQHEKYHESMDLVWDRGQVQRTTPTAAVLELLEAAQQLRRLGIKHPPEHWLAQASD